MASAFFCSGRQTISFDRKKAPRIRANEQIRVPEIRVIGADGNQLGVLSTQQALQMAQELGLDLVEISPTSRPPVCRIMDFGKFKYEQSKKQKQSKKKQHTFQVKEVKFRPKTEEHDYQFKRRHAEEFLEKHFKVKITVMFRGREMDHREMGYRILDRLVKDLTHVGTVDRNPEFEGRLMVMYMAPLPIKTGQQKKKAPAAPKPEKEESHAKAEDQPRGDETVS
ncbi:MAG TPA: translation initiation factor IF-3 [Candidatus Krumholzibacteria bacterium]|nr:translation initiation factor IF-3 [Candidatus Krumholzibacteria bacterium]